MHQPYSTSPDYWTLGIIIHEMVTGDAPYDRSFTNEMDSIEYEDRSMSTIESDTSGIIRSSSKHYRM